MTPWGDRAPSGADNETVAGYYTYIWGHYIQRIDVARTDLAISPIFWLVFFALLMAGFFFAFTFLFRYVHRSTGELYGPVSFAGYILERIGDISWWSWLIIGGTLAWAAYYVIGHTLYGQYY